MEARAVELTPAARFSPDELAIVAGLFELPLFPGVPEEAVSPAVLEIGSPLHDAVRTALYSRGLIALARNDDGDLTALLDGPEAALVGAVINAAATVTLLVAGSGGVERRQWYLRPEIAVQQREGLVGTYDFFLTTLEDVPAELLAFGGVIDCPAPEGTPFEVGLATLWDRAFDGGVEHLEEGGAGGAGGPMEPPETDPAPLRALERVCHLVVLAANDGAVSSREVLWIRDEQGNLWLGPSRHESTAAPGTIAAGDAEGEGRADEAVTLTPATGRSVAGRIVAALTGRP